MPKTVKCAGCNKIVEVPPVEGRQPDLPNGWATVSVAPQGGRIINYLMCPSCFTPIRVILKDANAK